MTQLKIDPKMTQKAEAAAKAVGVELPEFARRQMANQLHALLIGRMLGALADRFGDEVWKITEETNRALGSELAPQFATLLGTDATDARSLTRIVDLCNLVLDIAGEEVVQERTEVVRHERSCLLSGLLAENRSHRYCQSIFQPMYRGVLQAVNPEAGCNDMKCMMSKGDDHCEVITWLGRDHESASRPR